MIITESHDTENNIEDSKINDVIQYNNSMLIL